MSQNNAKGPNSVVTNLQGNAVSATAPTNNYVLTWVAANSDWEPKAAGGGGGGVSNVAPVTSYTANQTLVHGTDYFVLIGTLTGSITITLPASPTTGDRYEIKNGNNTQIFTNDAGTLATYGYSVTITPSSGTIDGQPSYIMTQAYDHITVTYNGTEWSISP